MKNTLTLCLLLTFVPLLNAAPPPPVTIALKKEVTVDPKRFEHSIAKFEKQDAKSFPPANSLLFLGSSSIRMWDLKKSFPHRETINRGFGGSHISDSIYFAKRIVLKYKPKAIVFYAGDNDVAKKKTAEQIVNDFRQFVAVVKEQLPKTKILYICIKPSIARWKLIEPIQIVNGQIEEICKKNKQLEYVDIWKPMLDKEGKPRANLFKKDGLHLNETGYAVWNELVVKALEE